MFVPKLSQLLSSISFVCLNVFVNEILFVFWRKCHGESSCARERSQPATSISKQINVINYLRFVSQMALRGMKEKKPLKLSSHVIQLFT